MVRLRRLLRDYYTGSGKHDPVIIELDGFRTIIHDGSEIGGDTQAAAPNDDDSMKALQDFSATEA